MDLAAEYRIAGRAAKALASDVMSPQLRGRAMTFEGGCYCRQVRYLAEGKPWLKAQCHCRECQYFSGGAPNMFMLMRLSGSVT